MVNKGITFFEQEHPNHSVIEYTGVEVGTGGKQKQSAYIESVYSSP